MKLTFELLKPFIDKSIIINNLYFINYKIYFYLNKDNIIILEHDDIIKVMINDDDKIIRFGNVNYDLLFNYIFKEIRKRKINKILNE